MADTLRTAEPDFFAAALGSRAGRVLREIVSRPGHAWSLDRARIADVDGIAAGSLLGGPVDRNHPDMFRTGPWGWARIRATAVSLAWTPIEAFMRRHDEGEWYINAVAVGERARGRGVGRALLRDAISQARDLEMSTVALHVDPRNSTAIGLYVSEGFDITDSWAPMWLAHRPLVHRMQMSLR